jgi:hypothetical protein
MRTCHRCHSEIPDHAPAFVDRIAGERVTFCGDCNRKRLGKSPEVAEAVGNFGLDSRQVARKEAMTGVVFERPTAADVAKFHSWRPGE